MEEKIKMLNIEKENENTSNTINVYEDDMVKNIFKKANEVAELHAVLTSGRGKHFRLNLLHGLATKQDLTKIEEFKNKVRLKEYKRHIDKLLEHKLIRRIRNKEKKEYIRTKKGGIAINVIRELQRRIKRRVASRIFRASLGVNSIRLFLRVYSYNKEIKPTYPSKIIFTPLRIVHMVLEALLKADLMELIAMHLFIPPNGISRFLQELEELD